MQYSGRSQFFVLILLLATSANIYAVNKPADFRFTLYSQTTGELFWERSTGSTVIGYELTRNGELLGVFDALSYMDLELVSGTSYEYTINAIAPNGLKSDTVVIAVNVPLSPADQVKDLQEQIDNLLNETTPTAEGFPAPVASTGQVELIRFGDDGDVQSGVIVAGERFKNNSDGTFTDQLTGITWLGVRECIVQGTWLEAVDHAITMADDGITCPALRDGSLAGDWRLPNIKELQSLLDFSRNSPAFAEGIPYEGRWSENPWTDYWSSTSFGPAPLIRAWAVSVDYGFSNHSVKELSYYSWPVKY